MKLTIRNALLTLAILATSSKASPHAINYSDSSLQKRVPLFGNTDSNDTDPSTVSDSTVPSSASAASNNTIPSPDGATTMTSTRTVTVHDGQPAAANSMYPSVIGVAPDYTTIVYATVTLPVAIEGAAPNSNSVAGAAQAVPTNVEPPANTPPATAENAQTSPQIGEYIEGGGQASSYSNSYSAAYNSAEYYTYGNGYTGGNAVVPAPPPTTAPAPATVPTQAAPQVVNNNSNQQGSPGPASDLQQQPGGEGTPSVVPVIVTSTYWSTINGPGATNGNNGGGVIYSTSTSDQAQATSTSNSTAYNDGNSSGNSSTSSSQSSSSGGGGYENTTSASGDDGLDSAGYVFSANMGSLVLAGVVAAFGSVFFA